MTTFQLVASVVFFGLLAAAYRNELGRLLSKLVAKKTAGDAVKPSIALTIVGDLVAVTELRDKLASENCPEGVDACTNLLRVIVEQTKPAVNAG